VVAGASGFILALAVVLGIFRNNALSRWFGALSISALAILLAHLVPAWRGSLLVLVLCAGFLYAEAKAARKGGSSAGA
jgi:hypothetical protein